MNWIDVVIMVVIGYYVFEGWQRGFVLLVLNLISFITSLFLAVKFHVPVGTFLTHTFGMSGAWTNVLGYITVAFVAQIVIEETGLILIRKMPEKISESRVNHSLGSVMSIVTGMLTVTFFLLLIAALPLRGTIKKDVSQSLIGSQLVGLANMVGGPVTSSIDSFARQATKFFTIEPGSNERISLDIPALSDTLVVDAQEEAHMFTLVNEARAASGVPALVWEPRIAVVGEVKSRSMFEHQYFSHEDFEGKRAGDRLAEAGIPYTLVGENLAYAPDTATAHQGLMDSPGHRANILEPKFHRVGIGVIDGGIYGKMYTQVFAD